jgi:hypothetical protein
MDGNGSDVPQEVLDEQRKHPECSFAMDSSTAVRIINGDADETTTRSWYMRCPGRPRQLIHRTKANRHGDVAGFAAGMAGRLGSGRWWSMPQHPEAEGVDGNGGSAGGATGLPDMDAFLRDFFGIPPERAWPGSSEDGRHPFPLPLPRPQRPPQAFSGGDGRAGARTGGEAGDGAAGTDDGVDGAGWELQPNRAASGRRPGPGGGGSTMAERERGRGVYI